MTANNVRDTQRALEAGKQILERRDPVADRDAIMVTLEHTVAAILLMCYPDPRMAAGILNEALVQGVEARITQYQNKSL